MRREVLRTGLKESTGAPLLRSRERTPMMEIAKNAVMSWRKVSLQPLPLRRNTNWNYLQSITDVYRPMAWRLRLVSFPHLPRSCLFGGLCSRHHHSPGPQPLPLLLPRPPGPGSASCRLARAALPDLHSGVTPSSACSLHPRVHCHTSLVLWSSDVGCVSTSTSQATPGQGQSLGPLCGLGTALST